MSSRARDDRGQVVPMLAILLPALFVLVGLVTDGGRILAAQRQVQGIAAEAARAGAQAIDLRSDPPSLDRDEATRLAQAHLDRAGIEGTVVVTDTLVRVTAQDWVQPSILRLVGIRTRTVTATATASPARGVTRPGDL